MVGYSYVNDPRLRKPAKDLAFFEEQKLIENESITVDTCDRPELHETRGGTAGPCNPQER